MAGTDITPTYLLSHDGKEVTPKTEKIYLVHIVGLSVDEALEILK